MVECNLAKVEVASSSLVSRFSFELPEDALVALKLDPTDAAAALRLATAVKLYELGRLSSGSAASLAGIPRVVFLAKLADYGVSAFRSSEDDLVSDLASA